jgi:hypothetical protein
VNFTDPFGLDSTGPCPFGEIEVVRSDGSSYCWSISGDRAAT